MGKTRKFVVVVAAAAAVAGGIAAMPASAAVVSPKVVTTKATCTGKSTGTLTLKYDNGRIEADNEVQTAKAGQSWRMRFFDNGVLFASATKTTIADGSVSATRYAANQAGTDHIKVRSRNLVTGEVCVATAAL